MPMPHGRPPLRIVSNSGMFESELWNQRVRRLPGGERRGTSWWIAFQLWRASPEYDMVLTVGHKMTVAYATLQRCWPRGRAMHVALEILRQPFNENPLRRLQLRALQHALRAADAVVLYSRPECELWARAAGISSARCHFLAFHSNVRQPHYYAGGDYALAAGRSERDYGTLLEAEAGLGIPVVIVAGAPAPPDIQHHPQVRWIQDVNWEQYESLLHGAAFVVVPLAPVQCSAGQAVILDAYGCGKAVIVTDLPGTRDYVQHEVQGLTVPVADAVALRAAMRRLATDPRACETMGRRGLALAQSYYSFEAYARRTLELLERIYAGPPAGAEAGAESHRVAAAK